MKKLVLATAVAMAATAAHAAPTLSGGVSAEFGYNFNSGAETQSTSGSLAVSGSEDLYSGLKVSYDLGLDVFVAKKDAPVSKQTSGSIAVEGSLGKLKLSTGGVSAGVSKAPVDFAGVAPTTSESNNKLTYSNEFAGVSVVAATNALFTDADDHAVTVSGSVAGTDVALGYGSLVGQDVVEVSAAKALGAATVTGTFAHNLASNKNAVQVGTKYTVNSNASVAADFQYEEKASTLELKATQKVSKNSSVAAYATVGAIGSDAGETLSAKVKYSLSF